MLRVEGAWFLPLGFVLQDRVEQGDDIGSLGNEIAFDSDIHGRLMRQVQWQDISEPLNFMYNSIRVWHFSSMLSSWGV